MFTDYGVNVHETCLRGQRLVAGHHRFDAGRSGQSQQRLFGRIALEDDVEESRIPVLILERLTTGGAVAVEYRRLLGFLRPFPGRPGLAADPVDLLQRLGLSEIEVADGGFAPLATDALEVVAHGCLRDAQLVRDR